MDHDTYAKLNTEIKQLISRIVKEELDRRKCAIAEQLSSLVKTESTEITETTEEITET